MKQRLLILLIMGLFRDLFFGCEDEKKQVVAFLSNSTGIMNTK